MLIETERHGQHVVLTLNRPDKLNALSYALIDELMDRLHALECDDSVRCLVLTGQGDRAFSAGADIAGLRMMWPHRPRRLAATSSRAGRP